MAKRFIDADNLIEHLEDNVRECGNPDVATEPITYGCSLGLKGALSYARTLPTADVVEVRHGTWEDRPNPQWKAYDIRHCSKCGWNIPKNNLRKKDLNWNYCPECGARMDGDEDD